MSRGARELVVGLAGLLLFFGLPALLSCARLQGWW